MTFVKVTKGRIDKIESITVSRAGVDIAGGEGPCHVFNRSSNVVKRTTMQGTVLRPYETARQTPAFNRCARMSAEQAQGAKVVSDSHGAFLQRVLDNLSEMGMWRNYIRLAGCIQVD